MNIHTLVSQSKKCSDILTIEATVTTGFEFLALDECREKCKPLSMSKAKGRLFFNIPALEFEKVLSLRSVDNILLVTETVKEISFEGKKEKDLCIVKTLVDTVDWEMSLKKWEEITGFKGIIYPRKVDSVGFDDGLTKTISTDDIQKLDTSQAETLNERKSNVDESVDEICTEIPDNTLDESQKNENSEKEMPSAVSKCNSLDEVSVTTSVSYKGLESISECGGVTDVVEHDLVVRETLNVVPDFVSKPYCDTSNDPNLHILFNQKNAVICNEKFTKSDCIKNQQNDFGTSLNIDPGSLAHLEFDTKRNELQKLNTSKSHEIENNSESFFNSDDLQANESGKNESISTETIKSAEGIHFEKVRNKISDNTEDNCVTVPNKDDLKEANESQSACTNGTNKEKSSVIDPDEKTGISVIENQEEDNTLRDSVEEINVSKESNIAEIKEFINDLVEEVSSRNEDKKQRNGRKKQFGRRNKGKPNRRGNQKTSSSRQPSTCINDGTLKFRATCYRVGEKHSFSSMEAACEFGGKLQDKFGWTVDLTQFDLNVILNIDQRQGYICIALTKESLHRRNITHFSNTTLRSTMCYNLFRLAEPMTGEIVVDPLCGGGSIPIEGALSFPNTYHVCGDYNEKAMERTRANIQHINKNKTELKIGPVRWNIKSLPLKAQSVDILVTDLPFGKRSGSKPDNYRLYSRVLSELAKVVRTGTGRACLLTYDRTSLTRALRSQCNYWREIRQFGVNQGGLFSTVFLLLRKATSAEEKYDDGSTAQTNLPPNSFSKEENPIPKVESIVTSVTEKEQSTVESENIVERDCSMKEAEST